MLWNQSFIATDIERLRADFNHLSEDKSGKDKYVYLMKLGWDKCLNKERQVIQNNSLKEMEWWSNQSMSILN